MRTKQKIPWLSLVVVAFFYAAVPLLHGTTCIGCLCPALDVKSRETRISGWNIYEEAEKAKSLYREQKEKLNPAASW